MNEEIPYNPPGMDAYIAAGARKNSELLRKLKADPKCCFCGESPHQLKDCPASQDFTTTRKAYIALRNHVRSSIDKDNDWGPMEWEAWNQKAKELLNGH